MYIQGDIQKYIQIQMYIQMYIQNIKVKGVYTNVYTKERRKI